MTRTTVTKEETARRAWQAMDHILAHPEQYEQGIWIRRALDAPKDQHCGTTGCLAGWVTLLHGDTPSFDYAEPQTFTDCLHSKDTGRVRLIRVRAMELLGIDVAIADDLFESSNTLGRLVELVIEIFGPRPAGILTETEVARLAAGIERTRARVEGEPS